MVFISFSGTSSESESEGIWPGTTYVRGLADRTDLEIKEMTKR
jgi:hypothetical protein